jgi:hypothetical protein
MEVTCIFEAWDSTNARHYVPGLVPDFDESNERLNELIVPGSKKYVFQYPGHQGVPDGPAKAEVAGNGGSPATPAAAPSTYTGRKKGPRPKTKTGRKPMTAEHRRNIREGIAKARAISAEVLAADSEEAEAVSL